MKNGLSIQLEIFQIIWISEKWHGTNETIFVSFLPVHDTVVVLQAYGLGPACHCAPHWGCLGTGSFHLLLHLLPHTRNPQETSGTSLLQCVY